MVKRMHLGVFAALLVCACSLGRAWPYSDAELGFDIEPPQGWSAFATSTPRPGLRTKAWVAPGQKGALSVTMIDIAAQPAPPRKYLMGDETASRQLGPDAYRSVSQGAVKAMGIEGWGSVSEFSAGGNKVQRRRAYFASGDKLYVVCGDAAPADYEAFSKAFEAAVTSFGVAGGAKPNSFKVVEGDGYTDPEFGFSVKRPAADWLLYTTKSPIPIAKRLLVASAPDGMSYASVTVCSLPANLTAQQCVQGDLAALKKADPGLRVGATAARQLGGVEGYAYLVQFAAGQKQMRWGVYAIHKGMLYMLITEAVPAASYEQWKDAFGQFAASFKFE